MSSTATTGTSTSRACCSSRSGSRSWTRSCGRADASCESGVVFHENEVESVALDKDEVMLDDGTSLPYDVLVVATGVRCSRRRPRSDRRRLERASVHLLQPAGAETLQRGSGTSTAVA